MTQSITQRIYRVLFLLFVTAGAVRLSAQTLKSEAGLWVVSPKWNDSTLGTGNISRSGQFDEKTGYGISFNHFWTESISTELSAQKFDTGVVFRGHTVEGEAMIDRGELDVLTITLMTQWHLNRAGRIAPYVGAGVTRLSADYEPDDIGPSAAILGGVLPLGPTEFKTEALTVAAGINVRLTDRIYLAGEAKYMPSTAIDRIEIDPLVLSAGVKVRF